MPRTLLVLAVPAFLFVACGAPEAEPITFEGRITSFVTGAGIEDASVCVHEPAGGCSASDADGNYTLGDVPGNATVLLRVTKDRFMTAYYHRRTAEADDIANVGILHEDDVGVLAAIVGTSVDPAAGHLAVLVRDLDGPPPPEISLIEDAVVSISPSAGEGPYYFDANETPDTDLDATTSSGSAAIVNVPPGTYDITVTHPTLSCRPGTRLAIPGEAPGTLGMRAEAGAVTYSVATCE